MVEKSARRAGSRSYAGHFRMRAAAAAIGPAAAAKSTKPQLRMKPSHSPSAQANVFSIESPWWYFRHILVSVAWK